MAFPTPVSPNLNAGVTDAIQLAQYADDPRLTPQQRYALRVQANNAARASIGLAPMPVNWKDIQDAWHIVTAPAPLPEGVRDLPAMNPGDSPGVTINVGNAPGGSGPGQPVQPDTPPGSVAADAFASQSGWGQPPQNTVKTELIDGVPHNVERGPDGKIIKQTPVGEVNPTPTPSPTPTPTPSFPNTPKPAPGTVRVTGGKGASPAYPAFDNRYGGYQPPPSNPSGVTPPPSGMSYDPVSGDWKRMSAMEDGGVVLHVGERDPNDNSGYATDEFVYAKPGIGGKVVVAPRPKNVKPTLANAVKLLKAKEKELVKAEDGAGIYYGSEYLLPLLAQMVSSGTAFATDLPLAQASIMERLGYLVPEALGVTDPEEFRNILSSGNRIPTFQATLAEQQAQAAADQFAKTFGLQTRQQDYSELTGDRAHSLALGDRAEDRRQFDVRSSLDEKLGMGDLAVRQLLANVQARAAEGDLEAKRLQIALQEKLGMGDLSERAASRQLQERLGLANLGETREDRLLRERLGMGDLDVRRQGLGLQGRGLDIDERMRGRELDLTERRIGNEEADQAFQRAIRGLKALPAVGNVASGMPTYGTASI